MSAPDRPHFDIARIEDHVDERYSVVLVTEGEAEWVSEDCALTRAQAFELAAWCERRGFFAWEEIPGEWWEDFDRAAESLEYRDRLPRPPTRLLP